MSTPSLVQALLERSLPEGGFRSGVGKGYRVDSTAWAVIALAASSKATGIVEAARRRLAADQADDGRVPLSQEVPQTFWPTPLAVLAWHGSPAHAETQARAVRFLLETSGRHWENDPDSPVRHDSSLKGWSWIEGTHSMVEPTALSLIALRASGYGKHERSLEAIRMLMDRQLSGGGWNYGNTIVYGRELRPQADCTGLALRALAGTVPPERVDQSLAYLEAQALVLRTPLSLGWSVLGLASWGRRPRNGTTMIDDCERFQARSGPYDTSQLSLLLLARSASAGSRAKGGGDAGPALSGGEGI